jgi:hypothetical protein
MAETGQAAEKVQTTHQRECLAFSMPVSIGTLSRAVVAEVRVLHAGYILKNSDDSLNRLLHGHTEVRVTSCAPPYP